MDLYYTGRGLGRDRNPGWQPVEAMVLLAARLFGARVRVLPPRGRSLRLRKLVAGWRRPPGGGAAVDLVIARIPHDAARLLGTECFSQRRRARALWIIDSFRIDTMAWRGVLGSFDLVAFTRAADGDEYRRLVGDRALYLPWGTDALDAGSAAARRDFDLLRVGRQPSDWADDDDVAAACAAAGLTFHGRPPDMQTTAAAGAAERQHALMGWYARTRFTLAFCNLVAPSPTTHPTKAYLTGRWTDSLAGGASVLGVPPAGDSDLVGWPGALVVTDGPSRAAGLARLVEAVAEWRPEQAARNHLEALRRLDWRWRFQTLAHRLDIDAPALEADLDRLRARISTLAA
jgi:hypothetical protein